MAAWRSPHDSHSSLHLGKRNALLGAIALSVAALLLQVIGAWFTGSLALLGDSAHVFTDLFSLVMSLVAVILATQPAHHGRSFGFYRLEVLASFVNGLLLFLVSLGLVKEGVERLWHPEPVKVLPMIAVAAVGLLFNLASAWLLHRAAKADPGFQFSHVHDHGHSHESVLHTPEVPHQHGASCGHGHSQDHSELHADRNLRSALLHVWSDALGSVAVILGGVAMSATGIAWIDAAVGILLAAWIFRWAVQVISDSAHVLLESTPRHVNAEKVISSLRELDMRVDGVDDLHVWELTSRMYAATAEVRVKNMDLREAEVLRQRMHHLMKESFGIAHVVLAIRPS